MPCLLQKERKGWLGSLRAVSGQKISTMAFEILFLFNFSFEGSLKSKNSELSFSTFFLSSNGESWRTFRSKVEWNNWPSQCHSITCVMSVVDWVVFEGSPGDVGAHKGGQTCWHCQRGISLTPHHRSHLFGSSGWRIFLKIFHFKVAQLLADKIEHNRCFIFAIDHQIKGKYYRWSSRIIMSR